MPPRKRSGRARAKDMRGRPRRRKVSPLAAGSVDYVDYKDVDLLRSFVSERAKIRSQRVSGNNRQQQREVARAIKIAREMALIEYARRPMTQRRGDKRRGPRSVDDRRPLADRAGPEGEREPALLEQHPETDDMAHPDMAADLAAVGSPPSGADTAVTLDERRPAHAAVADDAALSAPAGESP